MRPTQLLTMSALAGLSLISYGQSAHAGTNIGVGGSVTASCTLAVADGAFTEDGTPATNLVANAADRGTVVVTCNDGTKNLRLAIDNANSVVYNGIAKIRANGAGGIFGSTNTPGLPGVNPIVLSLANPTAATGDTVRVQSRVDAPAGKLLTAGNYNLVVNATITP